MIHIPPYLNFFQQKNEALNVEMLLLMVQAPTAQLCSADHGITRTMCGAWVYYVTYNIFTLLILSIQRRHVHSFTYIWQLD